MDPVGISNISIQLSWKYGQTHVMVQGFSPKPLKGNGGLVNEYMSFTKTKFFLIPQICDYIIPRHPVILVIFSSGSNHLSMVLGSTILRRWASIPREFTCIPEPRQVDSRCIFVYVGFFGAFVQIKVGESRSEKCCRKEKTQKIQPQKMSRWKFHMLFLNFWKIPTPLALLHETSIASTHEVSDFWTGCWQRFCHECL